MSTSFYKEDGQSVNLAPTVAAHAAQAEEAAVRASDSAISSAGHAADALVAANAAYDAQVAAEAAASSASTSETAAAASAVTATSKANEASGYANAAAASALEAAGKVEDASDYADASAASAFGASSSASEAAGYAQDAEDSAQAAANSAALAATFDPDLFLPKVGGTLTGTLEITGGHYRLLTDGHFYSSAGGEGIRAGLHVDGTNRKASLWTSGTERLTVTEDGNVGIGTDTPERKLEISSPTWGTHLRLTRPTTSTGSLDLSSGNAGGEIVDYAQIYGLPTSTATGNEKGSLVLATRDSGTMRSAVYVTSDGYMGVGTSLLNGTGDRRLQVGGTNTSSQILLKSNTTHMALYASSTGASYLYVPDGSKFSLGHGPADGTSYSQKFAIEGSGSVVVGTGAANIGLVDKTANVTMHTDGWMKITRNAHCITLHRTDSVGTIATLVQGANEVGTISVSASGTSYNTSSDYRLWWKEGSQPVTGSGEFIDRLRPMYFPLVGHAGFIAHEFQEVSPSSVVGEKDAFDENGDPVYQAMQASSADVMANIIAELQSLRSRVAVLEEALTAPEAELPE